MATNGIDWDRFNKMDVEAAFANFEKLFKELDMSICNCANKNCIHQQKAAVYGYEPTSIPPKYSVQETPTQEKAPDAWKHRHQHMRCRTCMWFVPKSAEGQVSKVLGRCRKEAPVVGQGWPAVFEDDWCGDHKLDENKT